jgi:hypothetical protein
MVREHLSQLITERTANVALIKAVCALGKHIGKSQKSHFQL